MRLAVPQANSKREVTNSRSFMVVECRSNLSKCNGRRSVAIAEVSVYFRVMNNASLASGLAMTAEEYLRYEITADCRHEYVNGQLFEMPGDKDDHNMMAGSVALFLHKKLAHTGWSVYIKGVKVSVPDGNSYYYPDVFLTDEERTKANHYVKYRPTLITEIISGTSHITDTVDKYIAYTTIPSLQYYLIIEPETVYVMLYFRNAESKWEAATYVRKTDTISLPALNLDLPLSEVYP